MAWDFISQHHAATSAAFDPQYSEAKASQALHELVELALGDDHGVMRETVLDHPQNALIAASKSADLMVVGARGLGGFRGLLLGSVSRDLLHHSAAPVAVVRDHGHDFDGPVVAGVDGSEHATRALQWAASAAAELRRRLVVVLAWHLPVFPAPFYTIVPDRARATQAAEDRLRRTIVGADLDWQSIEIDARAIEGRAAGELLATADSERASMLVVGARGSSGGLLGSVSDQVVHHAKCPVIVVP